LAGVEKITADILAAADQLRIISRNGIGIDNIDLEAAKARGIHIANTPGANSRGVAELALGLVFSLARGIPLADSSIKAGGWERRQGMELAEKTLGIVGCGQIGRTLAGMAVGIGMRVLGYDLYPDPGYRLEGFTYVGLEKIQAEADVISLHVPGSEQPLLDRDFIARLRKGVLLVNTARASVVDPEALLAALESGQVAGYGVDAFTTEPPGKTPLTSHSRVICTSHIGGFTSESVMRAASQASRNISEFLAKV
jgi:phosphoglycerate dehydrogenase-like enzyme